ncbi:MAG: type II toxin-antitoxin system VapC family toxin [Selenomonadaceae bacterium]|nr:type II toxin-antitoxin system VapC family toxin [Selenomonadaceae bacterium]MBR3722301.1 type II toxin-antitoxin system VapC family toxin [Selenomonadaceae bacterium]
MTDFNRIFIDTNPFIYLLDSKNEYTEKMEFIMDKLTENDCVLYSSPITVAEYMVHPYKENCPEKIKHFLSFIEDANIKIIDINTEIAAMSSLTRAKYTAFKGMDSLQLAAAEYSKCDMILTNDKQLCQYKEIHCMMIDECFQYLALVDKDEG